MTGWLLKLLLLLLILRALWRLLSGIIEGAAPAAGPSAERASVPLVRDPVCGTYVVRTRALAERTSDGMAYFCSERCRDAWLRQGRSSSRA